MQKEGIFQLFVFTLTLLRSHKGYCHNAKTFILRMYHGLSEVNLQP